MHQKAFATPEIFLNLAGGRLAQLINATRKARPTGRTFHKKTPVKFDRG